LVTITSFSITTTLGAEFVPALCLGSPDSEAYVFPSLRQGQSHVYAFACPFSPKSPLVIHSMAKDCMA